MDDLTQIKADARKAAFQRRKAAFDMNKPGVAGHLSEVLAGYRGVPLSGYMPIRTEIDPLPAMAEAAAHGPVGVPVIQAKSTPLKFSSWQPDGALRDGPFGAKVPEVDDYFEPEILIVPLVAFDARGGRLGYGGGFYDRTLELLRAKRATLAIGFAFDAQEADDLPLEPTDQPLDMLITESRVLQFNR
ncbi:5-formyltetrahydrofolate cyclo-ligase [Phaeobacter inhibens]|uniref:5-formyltetrahydrofolate cyclo-ligase n=1 Tax=Phaeobacter inhibens TaxID=221822 RepID=UPI00041B8D83|nr:5-formyltetrahydrofolate cyclo-ligase [Phaeobacter inhibens]AUQ59060.1 5-formyltetrahydrofolate cycloligase-like protein [Phaeobacter inhibens]AUQ63140.1 5-formyltetrahydrofolate cycloligase-like protein [Phaeobacter inhibens]AUQ83044.1 5-formyltetrahydrofolate cycloligase-like protein [Phaeobacter inhibens]AUQ90805.1 5-formyltetrahydrofolate cycloligase-like protein [Phaeobacter inhibens]AUR08342.1 5-formyltetrahydrofolate cycloligase-like protein [Phaeobacter inhibens]